MYGKIVLGIFCKTLVFYAYSTHGFVIEVGMPDGVWRRGKTLFGLAINIGISQIVSEKRQILVRNVLRYCLVFIVQNREITILSY